MISKEFIKTLALDQDKENALKAALKRDSIYRAALYSAGVVPSVVEKIMAMTDTSRMDISNADLLKEQIITEWADFRKDGDND